MRVLIVKLSSLGDVVHTLAAVTDAARVRPDVRFDWLVEEPFAEIPAWHPAVLRVIPVALRRWRRQPLQAWRSGQWGQFRERLATQGYDLVLDAQGLLKSAWLARGARGPRVGLDRRSAREPIASLFYRRRVAVARDLHAVERLRRLFAGALEYPLPSTPADFGLRERQWPPLALAPHMDVQVPRAQDAQERPQPYVVFLHATTWPTKCWPEARWQALGRALKARGLAVMLPWGSEAEREAAERIAAGCEGEVLPRLLLSQVAGVLARASFAVGVDTGLAHIAAAVGTRTVTLYGPTLPGRTGTVGADQLHLVSSDAPTVDRARPTEIPVERVLAALNPWLSDPVARA